MGTQYISPFKDGASISMVTGVLRGVGPMGPRGFTGDIGPVGPQGIPGPQPEMDPVSGEFANSSVVTLTNNGNWTDVPMTSNTFLVGDMASLNGNGSVGLQGEHPDGLEVVFTLAATVRPGASGTEDVLLEVGLFAGGAGTPFAVSKFKHTHGATTSTFTFTSQRLVSTGTAVMVKARAFNTAVSAQLTSTVLTVCRAGGPTGPTGIQGPIGATGPIGPTGPTGSAGGGYATMDALSNPADSDADPGGSASTTQALPYPLGTQKPAIPFLIKNLANAVQKRFVRRFDTITSAQAATDREVGQVNFATTTSALYLTVDRSGTTTDVPLSQVMMGTGDAPAGTYPVGTVYYKII